MSSSSYCYSCITFSVHNFKLLPICQLEVLGVRNPTVFLCFFLFEIFEKLSINYSNNTALQCYLLCIFLSVRRLTQLILCIGVSTTPHLKNTTPSFVKSPRKSANYPSSSFLGNSPPLPKKTFMHPSSKIKKI